MKALTATFVFALLFLIACQPGKPPAQKQTGELLARLRCSGCHAFPEPELLPRPTWEQHVLPRMGYMLGFYSSAQERAALLEQGPAEAYLKAAGVFPEQPQMDSTEWLRIQQFYLENAPDSLRLPVQQPPAELVQFEPEFPDAFLSPPSTTYINLYRGGLYLGDAHSKGFYAFNESLEVLQGAKVKEGAVSMTERPGEMLITVMGSFSPTDAPSGFLLELPKTAGRQPRVLIDSLQRPVHTAFADLNGDGREDAVICEFAKWTGRLAWWEALPGGGYRPHRLRDEPGATKTAVQDFNGDGLPDILALMAQGDEGFFLYLNEGNGQFAEAKAYELPPSYGSSTFRLVDYNGDAYPDIIYTAGDNADYPPVLKPYHGIRILENDGNNRFSEAFFYPMHGAYDAIPLDFDQDGDLDIAAISFFPDFARQPEHSFYYLENQGNMQMRAHTFPQATAGRWIVMDHGDLDGDGDEDLALGALAFEVIPDGGEIDRWVQNGIPFLLLRNKLVEQQP